MSRFLRSRVPGLRVRAIGSVLDVGGWSYDRRPRLPRTRAERYGDLLSDLRSAVLDAESDYQFRHMEERIARGYQRVRRASRVGVDNGWVFVPSPGDADTVWEEFLKSGPQAEYAASLDENALFEIFTVVRPVERNRLGLPRFLPAGGDIAPQQEEPTPEDTDGFKEDGEDRPE